MKIYIYTCNMGNNLSSLKNNNIINFSLNCNENENEYILPYFPKYINFKFWPCKTFSLNFLPFFMEINDDINIVNSNKNFNKLELTECSVDIYHYEIYDKFNFPIKDSINLQNKYLLEKERIEKQRNWLKDLDPDSIKSIHLNNELSLNKRKICSLSYIGEYLNYLKKKNPNIKKEIVDSWIEISNFSFNNNENLSNLCYGLLNFYNSINSYLCSLDYMIEMCNKRTDFLYNIQYIKICHDFFKETDNRIEIPINYLIGMNGKIFPNNSKAKKIYFNKNNSKNKFFYNLLWE